MANDHRARSGSAFSRRAVWHDGPIFTPPARLVWHQAKKSDVIIFQEVLAVSLPTMRLRTSRCGRRQAVKKLERSSLAAAVNGLWLPTGVSICTLPKRAACGGQEEKRKNGEYGQNHVDRNRTRWTDDRKAANELRPPSRPGRTSAMLFAGHGRQETHKALEDQGFCHATAHVGSTWPNRLVGGTGLEPVTPSLSSWCSNQLS